jgi:hypothetical protein
MNEIFITPFESEKLKDSIQATAIFSNGNMPYGQQTNGIKKLIEVLENNPLDIRMFCLYGFADFAPVAANTDNLLYPVGFVRFHGNFYHLSHVFDIVSNEREAIKKLSDAIENNIRKFWKLNQ